MAQIGTESPFTLPILRWPTPRPRDASIYYDETTGKVLFSMPTKVKCSGRRTWRAQTTGSFQSLMLSVHQGSHAAVVAFEVRYIQPVLVWVHAQFALKTASSTPAWALPIDVTLPLASDVHPFSWCHSERLPLAKSRSIIWLPFWSVPAVTATTPEPR